MESAESVSSPCSEGKLLKWFQVPSHLKFNPYIANGYRPLTSLSGCVKSLGYFHNETINILTHGLPFLYIVMKCRTLIPWDEIDIPVLPYTHLVSLASPWLGSSLYHLFMNHRSGISVYKRLLQLDMLGIWITQSFGALTTIWAAVYCFPAYWRYVLIVLYATICIWGLYKAIVAGSNGSPWDRRLCFLLPVAYRFVLVLLRTMGYTGGHPDSLIHVWLQDAIAIVGGIVGALRIPEKWYPGKFDFIFNSHHIMHVLVVVAVVHMHYAAVLDFRWLTEPQCSAQQNFSSASFSSLKTEF